MFSCNALRIAIVTAIASGLLPWATNECSAEDGIGCLICHKYPGLVTFRAPDDLSVLHVDEDKFLRSAHGAFGCKSCHTAIDRVPHTGVKEVNCTTGCHREDAETIAAQPLAGFHDHEQSFLVSVGHETACEVCHGLYPHSESQVTRAFLNLHAGFMFCDVCHTVQHPGDTLCYDWEDAEDAEFSGEPFGNYYNPRERRVQPSAHFISRIAVFAVTGHERYSLRDKQDIPKAVAFLDAEESMSKAERKKKLEYFHRGVQRRKPGAACEGCHSPGGMLDFQALGFGEREADYLAHLNIKALVTQYETFYFPNLFWRSGKGDAPESAK
jgi:hypothetical protein